MNTTDKITTVKCARCKYSDWAPQHDEPVGGYCRAPVGPKMPMCIEIIRHRIHPNTEHNCHAFEKGEGNRVDLVLTKCHKCGTMNSGRMWGGIFYCCDDHAPFSTP